jgi:hypothetical protein
MRSRAGSWSVASNPRGYAEPLSTRFHDPAYSTPVECGRTLLSGPLDLT